MEAMGFSNSPSTFFASNTVFRLTVIFIISIVLLKVSSKAIKTIRKHLEQHATDDAEETKRISTICRVSRYVTTVIISVFAGVAMLNELGVSIAPILGAAGVVGLAVGFGAQSLIRDYFNGFFLLLENQIRLGDVVEVGGKSGLVEEVTLRYVRLRDYDGNVHYVPNGNIGAVTNMSRDYAQSVIDVGVAYGEDLDSVFEVMRHVGDELITDEMYGSRILSPMEMAGVDRLDDSAVIIRCRFKVLPLEQWSVRREYLKRIKCAFDLHNIEIPFPHLTLYAGRGQDGAAAALAAKV